MKYRGREVIKIEVCGIAVISFENHGIRVNRPKKNYPWLSDLEQSRVESHSPHLHHDASHS